MLEGGAFNSITAPDPANIANDVVTFLTLWSPGQYLVPGSFIWLGTNYGLALSLTALIATVHRCGGLDSGCPQFRREFFCLIRLRAGA